MAALLLAVLVYWSVHADAQPIPPGDFGSYDQAATALWSGELPQHGKRMPFFPLCIGAGGWLFAGQPHPHLVAASLCSLVCSAGILLVLWMLGRRFLGPAAWLPVVLLLTTRVFHLWALQPLTEPLFTLLLLLALEAMLRGSRWAWVAASLAALTRMEGLVLLAALGLVEAQRQRRVLRPLRNLALAALAPLAWVALTSWKGEGAERYVGQMSAWAFDPAWRVFGSFVTGSVSGPAWRGVAAMLCVLGLLVCLRRKRNETLAVVAVVLSYLLPHVAFGVDLPRYQFPVQWALFLFVAVGAVWVVSAAATTLGSVGRGRRSGLLCLGVPGFAMAWWALETLPRWSGLQEPWVYSVAFVMLVLFAGFGALASGGIRRSGPAGAILVLGMVAMATTLTFGHQVRGTRDLGERLAGSHLAGLWLDQHLQDEERALVVNCWGWYGTGLEPEQGVTYLALQGMDWAGVRELIGRRGIQYVLYWPIVQDPSQSGTTNPGRDRYYWNLRNLDQMVRFADGDPVEGFAHVAALPLPGKAAGAVQVYRVLGEGG